jgi:cysteinyl-tRNA synthetase
VSIRLYDTASRTVRDFVPVREGSVGIYHCGLTVQAAPHIGHIRKEVAFDVLRRWFDHRGYEVTLIANVTDIDDKILVKSGELQQQWWALAYANERLLHQAYDLLGCLPPSYEPRATGHIPEMLEMIDTLVDKGHAYVAEDGSGDVYFDVRSWPTYGELSNQRIEDMEAATDADPRGKRDPRDFALWKGHKAGEPHTASWATPWGRGRPGWHLECSAMVGKYLGSEFDIHGGGLDLRFPHHENEMAQSRAAGHGFARYWMHNALVTTAGEKMSKSLGNSALVSEVVKHVRPIELRYYLVAAHYRSVIEFSFESLAEAGAAFKRIEGYVMRASELTGAGEPATELPQQFSRAMDEDLGVPAALAVLQGTIREANKQLGDVSASARNLASVRGMLAVLGLDPLAGQWSTTTDDTRLRAAVDALVASLVQQRAAARAARDFAAADAIREQLQGAGIEVEDTADGARWNLSDS